MNAKKLKEILVKHAEWLKTEGEEGERADLRSANLHGANLHGANLDDANLDDADLRGADLRGANLDYSVFPLWCGTLKMHIDDRQATQLLYHLVSNVLYSKNTSQTMKNLCSQKALVDKANEFHRVVECRRIVAGEDCGGEK